MNDLKMAEIGDSVKVFTKDGHVIAPMKILELDREKLTVLIGPPENKYKPLNQNIIGSSITVSAAPIIRERDFKRGDVVLVKSKRGKDFKLMVEHIIEGKYILLRSR